MKARKIVILAGLWLALPVLQPTAARAQNAVLKVGTLTCSSSGGIGLIIGSTKNMSCNYQPFGGGPPDPYAATLTKVGLDIGITGPTTMVWTVLAPTAKLGPRALSGNYIGASADVAVGIGGGAKVLVGGSNNSIALQPLSIQGQTGINLAIGVASFVLH